MRWLLVAVLCVLSAVFWLSMVPSHKLESLTLPATAKRSSLPRVTSLEMKAADTMKVQSSNEEPGSHGYEKQETESGGFGSLPQAERLISIGPYMDPSDPATWPEQKLSESLFFGEVMNPRDPATWGQLGASELLEVGRPLDPRDPVTWYSSQFQPINHGPPIDPSDLLTIPQYRIGEVINVGAPMNVGDPITQP